MPETLFLYSNAKPDPVELAGDAAQPLTGGGMSPSA